MEPEKLSVLVHAVVGVIAGYVSFLVNDNLGAVGVIFLTAVIMRQAANKIAKEKKDIKWWLGNGAGTLILLWFISWMIFFNFM